MRGILVQIILIHAVLVFNMIFIKIVLRSFIILGIARLGLSLGSAPGLLFSSGLTWQEMRRTSLHTLKDFGLGKSFLENIVEEEIDDLFEYIDNHHLNQPIDVRRF